MVTSVTKGGTPKFPQKIIRLKLTDTTIHWKAPEEHFLMAPFLIRPFLGKIGLKVLFPPTLRSPSFLFLGIQREHS
jgi:hypothetical protein